MRVIPDRNGPTPILMIFVPIFGNGGNIRPPQLGEGDLMEIRE